MPDVKPSVTTTDFKVLTTRAGLTLSDAQHDTLFEVYGQLEAMLARLRSPSERPRSAEPAHIFVPGQGWPV